MKPSTELAAFLGDTSRHRQSRALTDEVARRIADMPIFADLERDFAAMQDRTLEAVGAAAERFLACDDALAAIFHELVAAADADPFFRPPFLRVATPATSGLLLFENESLAITLNVVSVDGLAQAKVARTGPRSISFTGVPFLYRFIKGGDAVLELWKSTAITPGFAAEHARCSPVRRRVVSDGDWMFLDGRRETFIIESAASDIVHVQAALKVGAAPLGVEYDASTRKFIGASSTDEAASRTQMMVTLLRMLDREDAVPVVLEALRSDQFFVRWHVMRELLALDADAALPCLREMVRSDPHPEVRAAASQALASLFAEEEGAVLCPA